jgi:hypothetical protein
MIFKELLESDKKHIVKVYGMQISHAEKMTILTKKFKVTERTIRRWFANLGLNRKSIEVSEQLIKASNREILKDTEVLLVTSAQNNTDVNEFFLENIKCYKKHIEETLKKKCQIVITASRYRNPSSLSENEKEIKKNYWDSKIDEYLFYKDIDFYDVKIAGTIFVSPTAKNPLNGFELLASNNHLVLSHSKIHLKTIPRFRNDKLRIVCSTGYITNKNYSASKAGALGEANHSFGFVVIEKKNNKECYNPRNVKVSSSGTFTDLCYEVSEEIVEKIDTCEAIIMGDIHTRVLNKEFYAKTKTLASKIKPNKLVLHDVLDASTINHHEVKDMYIQRKKIRDGKHLLEEEINESLDFIEDARSIGKSIYVVESNHDFFLDTHVNSANWKNDLHNSPIYLKLAYIQQTQDLDTNIFGHLVKERFKEKNVEYIPYGERFFVSSYNIGSHGDFGSNGSRGSAKSFANLNQKMVHGHTHSPSIIDGVTCVGVSSELNQYYNRRGLSSWAYAHCLIHNTGKPQLIIFDCFDYSFTSLIN